MTRKRITGAVLGTVLALCLPFGALGATKPINSISIQVSSKLEAGQSLPEIEIGNTSVKDREIGVKAGNSKYTLTEAEWVDKASDGVEVAEEPRMKVTLEPTDVSEDYFLASYRSSNVKVSGGSFVSAKRDGDSLVVTLRVKAVKGDFDPPEDAYWNEDNLGEARWKKGEFSSGYYEVQLYRDNKSVYHVDKTTAQNYNFYPYMTKEGDYTFKVRSIAGTDFQKKYGDQSEWVESGEITITDRYVSDGKGQQKKDSTANKGTSQTVGWFQNSDKTWSYRYPDGSMCRGGWSYINGKWYYFDVEAKMLTGWQQIYNRWYYLHADGQMALGWSKINGLWYYFLPFAEGNAPEGSMVSSGWRVIGAYYYYFNADGSLYTGWLWDQGSWYYLNTVDNSLQGALFTGWIKRDTKTYYADTNGAMVEGWWQIEGNWYYFYPGSGEMAQNTEVNGFYLNGDGVWIR